MELNPGLQTQILHPFLHHAGIVWLDVHRAYDVKYKIRYSLIGMWGGRTAGTLSPTENTSHRIQYDVQTFARDEIA